MTSKQLKIGIKYCGGCNPTYQRELVEKILREIFPQFEFFYKFNINNIDLLVVICGCKTACVRIPEEFQRKTIIFDELVSPDEVKSKLKEVL